MSIHSLPLLLICKWLLSVLCLPALPTDTRMAEVSRGCGPTLRQVHSGKREREDKQTNTYTTPQVWGNAAEKNKTWRQLCEDLKGNLPALGSQEQNPKGAPHVHYRERSARDVADCELGIGDSPPLLSPADLCSWYSSHPCCMGGKWLQGFAVRTEARMKFTHHLHKD